MISVAPASSRRRSTRSSMGWPPTSMRALGMASVAGRRRLPTPAARTMAFMSGNRRGGERFQPEVLELDVHLVALAKARGQALGAVDRAMLAAGAAEGDGQRGEIALLVALHGLLDHRLGVLEELQHGR